MSRKHILKLSAPIYVVIGLLVIATVLAALELTNTTHLFHHAPVPPVIPISSSGSSASNSSSATSNSQTQASSQKSTSGLPDSSLPLYMPYGDFVSNHYPGANGAPTSETSVCNTTPGASCYIKFTNGNTSTQLPTKTTDSKGAAAWYWDTNKDAHLTAGSWTITAVAALNGKTKTSQDQLKLVISQ